MKWTIWQTHDNSTVLFEDEKALVVDACWELFLFLHLYAMAVISYYWQYLTMTGTRLSLDVFLMKGSIGNVDAN